MQPRFKRCGDVLHVTPVLGSTGSSLCDEWTSTSSRRRMRTERGETRASCGRIEPRRKRGVSDIPKKCHSQIAIIAENPSGLLR